MYCYEAAHQQYTLNMILFGSGHETDVEPSKKNKDDCVLRNPYLLPQAQLKPYLWVDAAL